jgi:hypothetical protein
MPRPSTQRPDSFRPDQALKDPVVASRLSILFAMSRMFVERRGMFRPRRIESRPAWSDPDGIKVYTISARNEVVDQAPYFKRLEEVKSLKPVAWASTPAFVVFHDGASCAYLVLGWWGNDNELFTSVSVNTESGWVEDGSRYSFCVYDLEVFWQERNYFIQFIDCPMTDLGRYRAARFSHG